MSNVYYRFSTDAALLSHIATTYANYYSTPFAPTSLFIATWDRVARYDSDGTKVSLHDS